MWFVAFLVVVAALLVVVWISNRRESQLLDRAVKVLRSSGYEGLAPGTLEHALDRFELMLDTSAPDPFAGPALAALDHLTTGVVVADKNGDIVVRNAAAMPYAAGRHGDALVEAEIRSRLHDAMQGEPSEMQLELHGPPDRQLLVAGTPFTHDGEVTGAIVMVDDVSEQRRIDAVRRDFVANVSHELRTPVGALSLLAETLEGEQDPAVAKRLSDRMQGEAARLSRLIDDLLDLSRIEGGVSEFLEPTSLSSVVQESASAVRPLADAGGITLDLELGENTTMIIGDHSQLVSAVTNLFENAVKYTEPGGTVTGRLVSHGDEVAVAVVDTGIGIPHRDVNRIFERFYRVDRARSTKTGGTGLGLSIVRHVAANHGGRVEVVSHEGAGSTFTLVLPVESRERTKASA